MKNVYLIDLGSGSNMHLLPLAIGLIGSYSMAQPELAEVYDFHFQYLRSNHMDKVNAMADPAVVGLSCYIWNFQGSLRLASMVKERFPNTKIVLGGFSIPKAPDRVSEFLAANPFVDVLVHGEGEITFANLLRGLANGSDLSAVNGITIKTPDVALGFVTTMPEKRVVDLQELPSPFLNGVFDRFMAEKGSSFTGVLWETNRGCPYSCTFCDWGHADVRKVMKHDMDRLKAELDWISRNDFFYVFNADANFGIFKDRDMKIAGWLADNSLKYGSPKHVVTNWAKNKHKQVIAIADRLAKGDIASSITLAVQSYHEPTLDAIKRRNIKQDDMLSLKKEFHDRNIPTYVELILGLPLETYDSFVSGLNKALTPRISDRFVVYLGQLLENTELASAESREEFQIKSIACGYTTSNCTFEDMEESEIEEIIIGTSTLPVEDWGRAYLAGYLLTVLYNHRVAFFILNYLHHQHGSVATDFVEFVLSEWRADPDKYERLFKGINHLDKQRQLILDGDSYLSGMEGYEELNMLPAAAALALMVSGIDDLYQELRQLTLDFAAAKSIEIDTLELDDVITYQQARMPAWPMQERNRVQFNTNIPEYFELLTAGLTAPEIIEKKLIVTVEDYDRYTDRFAEFAVTLVRGSFAVDLLEINIAQGWVASDHTEALAWQENSRRQRRKIEQQSIDKLKIEFRKLHNNDDHAPPAL